MIKCSYCGGRHELASETRECWENATSGATRGQPRTRTSTPDAAGTGSKTGSTRRSQRTTSKKAGRKSRKARRRKRTTSTSTRQRQPTGKTWTRNSEASRPEQIPSASGKPPAASDVVEEMGRRARNRGRSSPRRMHDRGGTPTVEQPADTELHRKIGRANPENRGH